MDENHRDKPDGATGRNAASRLSASWPPLPVSSMASRSGPSPASSTSPFSGLQPIRKGIESGEPDVIRLSCGRFAEAGNGVDGGTSTCGGPAWPALPV